MDRGVADLSHRAVLVDCGESRCSSIPSRRVFYGPQIPSRIEDLTTEWFTQILRETLTGHDVWARAVQLEPLGSEVGAMSESVRCRLDYDSLSPDCPTHVSVKLATTNPVNRGVARFLQQYRREVCFYRIDEVVPNPPLAPCYWARHAPKTDDMVVVLNNIDEGVRRDFRQGVSDADAAQVLTALAPIHHWGWERPNLSMLTVCALGIGTNEEAEANIACFAQAWAKLKPRLPSLLPPADADWLGNFMDNLTLPRQRQLLTTLARMPRTMVHGDLHLDNILFAPWVPGVVLLDWQSCGAGPAVLDLGYFIGGSVCGGHQTDALLREYHAALDPAVRAKYPWEQLHADYRWGVVSSLRYLVMVGGSLDWGNGRLMAFFQEGLKRMTAEAQALEPLVWAD